MQYERAPLPNHGTMENYTTLFLVVAGVLCWILLVTIWVSFGFLTATIGAFVANRLIPTRQEPDLD